MTEQRKKKWMSINIKRNHPNSIGNNKRRVKKWKIGIFIWWKNQIDAKQQQHKKVHLSFVGTFFAILCLLLLLHREKKNTNSNERKVNENVFFFICWENSFVCAVCNAYMRVGKFYEKCFQYQHSRSIGSRI